MGINAKETVKKFKLRLTKSLGQNFLTDESIIKQIAEAAEIKKDDLVIEIGPGIGNLTIELAQLAGSVVAVEIDKYLIPALTENLKDYNNIEIMNADILKLDIKKDIIERAGGTSSGATGGGSPASCKIVANLPYYITTPIIMKLLEEQPGLDLMVFMVQKEVADRMAANPGKKDYGALSVAVQYYSRCEKLFNVPPHSFIPQPDVDSTVIRLNIYKEPPVVLKDRSLFFKTVRAAFGQRRKTLVNALSNSGNFNVEKEKIKDILKVLGIGENQRGETLTIMQFAELSNAFYEKDC